MLQRRSPLLLVSLGLLVSASMGCGAGAETPTGTVTGAGGSGSGGGDQVTGSGSTGVGGEGTGAGNTGSGGQTATGTGGGSPTACVAAEGSGPAGTDTWQDGAFSSTVTVDDAASCARTYTLSTTAPLRDGLPSNPRTFGEQSGQPVIRTNHDMFDALDALALEEAREDSVDAISDGSFNGGQPLPCPEGGCFETGRLWKYVWTRDTAYSAALGLAAIDPLRTKNSLLFKISPRRDGSRPEIVQDTGTGGSWPISSDCVVWAMGAWELLKYLEGDEREAFLDVAYEAIANTADRDREVVWDPTDGLYRGEQSFLDWREQSYPSWTATDTVQIGMSKALGTNIAHHVLLDVAAKLAAEKGDSAAETQYAAWAEDLRAAIAEELWLEDQGLFSTFKTTTLDPAATSQFDLVGSAFSVLYDIGTPSQSSQVVSSYPHLEKGAPVIFPQQKDTPIYHNRATWPFATAFWLRAAAKVENAAAIDHAVRTLVRGAAMNLSNMENFEIASGAPWVDDGPSSGPVVNSQRQLWSVAGYLSMVHDVIFGLQPTQEGLRFAPRITNELRASLFGGADSIALSHFPYKGKLLSVVVHLPPAGAEGVLTVAGVRVDGLDVGSGVIAAADLQDGSVIDVDLGPASGGAGTLRTISAADLGAYQNLFGPKSPILTSTQVVADRVQITWSANGEAPGEVTFDVYRDGERIAEGLAGSTTSFTDPASGDHATTTHCYSVEAKFTLSGNASQHAKPSCYWGAASQRVQVFGAQGFAAIGGQLVNNHGRWHHEDWGDPTDTLTITNVTPTTSGTHFLQVLAGNGAGGFTTGITCAVKAVEVWDGGVKVGGGQLAMPDLGTWDDWRDSSLVRVELEAGTPYTVVIREDASSGNMSDFEHFTLYGGTGGQGGRFNKVNIAELKLLALGPAGELIGAMPPVAPPTSSDVVPRKVVVYQLVVRTFSNTNETRAKDGTIEQNGVGRFDDIDDVALAALADLGVTHVWLTGVLRQATLTDHGGDLPPDDPDVVKGRAGSFYAVRDYFDVCPDYATDVERRLDEFDALVARIHAAGLRVVIDLVPNHVARGYGSVVRPDLDFGREDDTSIFFSGQNDFFYLAEPRGQVLSLTRPDGWNPPGVTFDGLYAREDGKEGRTPKATGDDGTSPSPGATSWYETVKLNWGRDFTTGRTAFDPRPPVWDKVDAILAYWQARGVDGFRVDFAHWVPVEAWRFLLARVKGRDPSAYAFAEAYENLGGLLEAGFDAVYRDEAYDLLKRVYQGSAGASDVDAMLGALGDAERGRYVHYLENHDERRIASPLVRGVTEDGTGFGTARAGKQLAPLLYLCSQGPIVVHAGQEVGEEGAGVEGFGGEDGRTTIFDYWSMPAMVGWVNGHAYDGGGLTSAQRELRAWYRDLLGLCQDESVRGDRYWGLRYANQAGAGPGANDALFPFARFASRGRRVVVVVVNLGLGGAQRGLVRLPAELAEAAALAEELEVRLLLDETGARGEVVARTSRSALSRDGLAIVVADQAAHVYAIA